MHGRCLLIALLLCLTFAPTSSMPQNHALPPPVGGITFEQVIRLSQSGLSDAVIIAQIQKRPQPFNLSPDELLQLKDARVSNNVIEAMMPPSSAPAVANPVATTTASQGDADDPLADHDAGIYMYYTTSSGKHKLVELEPTVYTQGKSNGYFATAMTYGIAKIKWRAIVRSPHSAISTVDPNAVFYFYFEEKGAGLSHSSFNASTSTPNEFTLLHFDVKKDSRETIVMQMNAFGGQTGSQDNAIVQFTSTKLRPGVYKVTPSTPLHPGEYCFLSGQGFGGFMPGAASANKLFDFGITE
jgi:hypothetical protein